MTVLLAAPALADLTVLELECIGAAPQGMPVRIEADPGGSAVLLTPYTRRAEQIGALVPVAAVGSVALAGAKLHGTVKGVIPYPDPRMKKAPAPLAVDLSLQGTQANGVVTGTWTAPNGATGALAGFCRTIPEPRDCDFGTLTMVTAYPVEGGSLGLGLGGKLHRLSASFNLKEGGILDGRFFPGPVVPGFYPVKSYTAALWVDACGRTLEYSTRGLGSRNPGTGEISEPFLDTVVRGVVGSNRMNVVLQANFRKRDVTWTCPLKRSGALWHGTWKWEAGNLGPASAVAVARLGRAQDRLTPPAPADGGTARDILLRHALALAAHPSNAGWHDDVLTSAVAANGNKQYDNAPNAVGAGILTGLLIHRLSPDPVRRAEGLAMARRASYWWQLARIGPLRVGEYYKGMFWTTAWAGFGLAELTRLDPQGPWQAQTADLATAIRDTQLASGAWTWVDEETGEKGHSNERGDRSLDNRELNGGDLLLAMAQCAAAAGLDTRAAETRARDWLAAQYDQPSAWFFRDRRPGESKDALPAVCFLQYLAAQSEPDLALCAKVRNAIEREFAGQGEGLLTGYFPRAAPGDPAEAVDVSSSARYAHALALLARRGDQNARRRAEGLVGMILAKAGHASGIIDHYGRDLPGSPEKLAKVDSHSYLCLKAGLAWETLNALEALDSDPRQAGVSLFHAGTNQ